MPDAQYYKNVLRTGKDLTDAVNATVSSLRQVSDEEFLKNRQVITDMLAKVNFALDVTTELYAALGTKHADDAPDTHERPSNPSNGGGIRFRD